MRDSLGYGLTAAQERVVAEITADMAASSRMLRLLQGDVGSGKTVVAALALLSAVEAGGQAALMVPTEILARQHFETMAVLLYRSGLAKRVRLEILTGRDKGKARAEKLRRLAAGQIDIAIGTHALFEDDVEIPKLSLAVIDEQHRFGVHQRLRLGAKGDGARANILAMTATPIPRTLAMTSFGDMDISVIDEMPPGRHPVSTKVASMAKLPEIIVGLKEKLAAGELKKLYWVCPLVEESETSDLSAVRARFEHLKAEFGDAVGLAHGKMKAEEKDAVMADFADPAGRTKILVATTVIEVGLDVPEANLMIIEHAERFGLSSLHQLRGRIGRGGGASLCLLLHSENFGAGASARLSVLKSTSDGFKIAEEDLRLRGSGDILGVRQSGMADFKIADLSLDQDLFIAARRDIGGILDADPSLSSLRGLALRTLLELFEYKEQLARLSAG
jgi:ATP-dependent DNA helicase RecG